MAEADTKHYIRNGSEEAPAARDALEWAGATQAQLVDLKFCDLLGRWQHMTLPLTAFDESAFDEGLGFSPLVSPLSLGGSRYHFPRSKRPQLRP